MKAFITLGIGQSYIDSCELLADHLLKYTTADVLIYYGNGKPAYFASPRLHKINLEGLTPGFDIKKFPNPLNPFIIKETLKTYDEVVYLDCDIQVTPNINQAFKEVKNITTYPLACRYAWYYSQVNGNPWVGEKITNNIPYEKQSTPTLGVCCTVSNKQCLPFLTQWIDNTLNLIPQDIEDTSARAEGIHEEAIFNAMVWQVKGEQFIPTKLAWSPNPEVILVAEEIYASPKDRPHHPDWTNPTFLLEKNTWDWNFGFSCLPLNKTDFWGVHTIKTPSLEKETYLYIEKFF